MNKKCQVFTPENYVKEMLDSVGYKEHLYGKRILENSCGDGKILVVIVQRYIDDCIANGLTKEQTKEGLSRDIYGIEIDWEQYQKCIENLNGVLQRNNIDFVKWNIYNKDYLCWDGMMRFDFIVGNPPYITYNELNEWQQKYVRDKFETCAKGKFDYCYAFIEKSVKSLSSEGKMAYLIPSSIFKTVYGENLRNFIKPFLQEIRDYAQDRMFDNALVKSAIMVLAKKNKNIFFRYYDGANGNRTNISISNLTTKWIFTTGNIYGMKRFGDYFHVAHVVATLLNKAFVMKEKSYTRINGCYQCNGHDIEEEIVKETATPRSLRYNKVEKIIFPYSYKEGKLVRYSEEEFKQKFPGANAYLEDFKEELKQRKSDDKAAWFEYGRSQALSELNKNKLLISTVITGKVTAYPLKKDCIPYAGMFIVPRTDENIYNLEDARKILESEDFLKYVKAIGIHISGKSIRVTSRDIENYMF